MRDRSTFEARGPRVCAGVLLALSLVACGGSADEGPSESRPAANPADEFELHAGSAGTVEPSAAGGASASAADRESLLLFRWPNDAEAIVTEDATKQSKTTRIRYRIRLEPPDAQGNRGLRYSEFTIVSMQDVDMNDPQLTRSLGGALAIMQAVPNFGVGPGGEYLGPSENDLAGMVERVAGELAKLEEGIAMKPEEFRASMATPGMRGVLRAMNADAWNAWAGSWSGAPRTAGERTVDTIQLPFGQELVEARVVTENHGVPTGEPDQLRLSIEMRLSGPELGEPVKEFLASTAKKLASPGDGLDSIEPLEWTFTSRAEVVLDPRDSRPSRASYEKRVQAGEKGEGKLRIERHEYRFEWQ